MFKFHAFGTNPRFSLVTGSHPYLHHRPSCFHVLPVRHAARTLLKGQRYLRWAAPPPHPTKPISDLGQAGLSITFREKSKWGLPEGFPRQKIVLSAPYTAFLLRPGFNRGGWDSLLLLQSAFPAL